MRVAIVGAGVAGLACARRLIAAAHTVTVFDKGKRPGGRMSSRSVMTALGDAGFDHGAQYFTARDPAFQAEVARWHLAGAAAPWPAAGSDAWVGVPTMNAPAAALAAGLDVRSGVRIDHLHRHATMWHLDGAGPFDAAIVALPAEQAAILLADADPAGAARAAATPSQPCWTVMAAFAAPVPIAADIIRDAGSVGWAARDSAKPGRSGPESWVIQATPAWSQAHLEDPADTVAAALALAFAEAAGVGMPPSLTSVAHRWRYARSGSAGGGTLWNARLHLGVCGDWLLGPRIEAAWLSGDRLAQAVIGG